MDLREKRMRVFKPGEDRDRDDDEILAGLDNPAYAERFGMQYEQAEGEIELVQRRRAAVRPRGLPRRPPDADVLRLGDQQLRRARGARRAGRPGAAAGATRGDRSARSSPDEPKFSGVVFKIQANMDPAHRDRIAFVRVASRPLRARHAAEGRALGQGAAAEHRGDLPLAAPRAARRGLRRRHHRHPQPRRAAARRHAHRRRGAAVHRPAVLRARDVPHGRGRRPAAHQAAARRADPARRGGRDPGVPAGRRHRCCCSARSASCSSRSSRTGSSTSTACKARILPAASTSRAG